MTRIETLAIIHQPPKILLGLKKKKFGKGKWNGFGGGLNNGETLLECVIRETKEEANIIIINPRLMGRILFKFLAEKEQDHLVYFFKVKEYYGTPKETNEMKAEWFNENQIPYNQMWPDDKYWLPFLLRNNKFIGEFNFREKRIDSYKLKKVLEIK